VILSRDIITSRRWLRQEVERAKQTNNITGRMLPDAVGSDSKPPMTLRPQQCLSEIQENGKGKIHHILEHLYLLSSNCKNYPQLKSSYFCKKTNRIRQENQQDPSKTCQLGSYGRFRYVLAISLQ